MKTFLAGLTISCSFTASLFALSPEQDKAFVDKYKAAYESGVKATLQSLLYTKDALPMALEFYKAMQSDGAGTAKITKIELVDLTPDDVKQASEIQSGPDGSKAKFSLKPVKKLMITIDTGNSGSSGTMSNYVAEVDGKYVIPVPVKAD